MLVWDMIMRMVSPIAKRALLALGIGVATYVGYSALLSTVAGLLSGELGATTGAVLKIISLYGLPESMGIMLGAFAVNVSLSTFKRFEIL